MRPYHSRWRSKRICLKNWPERACGSFPCRVSRRDCALQSAEVYLYSPTTPFAVERLRVDADDAGGALIVLAVEQEQLHAGRLAREDAEVHPARDDGRADRKA